MAAASSSRGTDGMVYEAWCCGAGCSVLRAGAGCVGAGVLALVLSAGRYALGATRCVPVLGASVQSAVLDAGAPASGTRHPSTRAQHPRTEHLSTAASPHNPDGELDVAGFVGRRDHPRGRVRDVRIGLTEVGVVEQVVDLAAELDADVLDREPLGEREVGRRGARTDQ